MWRVAVLCLPLLIAVWAQPSGGEQMVHVTARKFAYEPSRIVVHRGIPVVLELTALDREHGFRLPALGLAAKIQPGQTTEVRFVPTTAGVFPFACNVFCGSGHDDMSGELVVVE